MGAAKAKRTRWRAAPIKNGRRSAHSRDTNESPTTTMRPSTEKAKEVDGQEEEEEEWVKENKKLLKETIEQLRKY